MRVASITRRDIRALWLGYNLPTFFPRATRWDENRSTVCEARQMYHSHSYSCFVLSQAGCKPGIIEDFHTRPKTCTRHLLISTKVSKLQRVYRVSAVWKCYRRMSHVVSARHVRYVWNSAYLLNSGLQNRLSDMMLQNLLDTGGMLSSGCNRVSGKTRGCLRG